MKLPMLIALIISIAITLIILYFTIDAQTIAYFKSGKIRYDYFLAAICVNIVYFFIWGLRLQILSNATDKTIHIGFIESTKIVFANLFLADITPSMAGGEPVRIYLLKKDGLSYGSATAAVLGERLLDAIFLLLCVPFGFYVFSRHLNNAMIQIGLSFAVFIFILVFVVFIISLRYPEKIKHLLFRIATKLQRFSRKKTSKYKLMNRISDEIDSFHQSMMFFIKEGKKTFFLAGIVTALFWITGWIIPILLLLGLGLPPSIIASCAAQILLIVIVMMPTTPGSSGVSEGVLAALYGVFVPASLLGVFILLFRLITYYMGLIIGAIFQYRIFNHVASFSMDMIEQEK